MKVFWVVVIIVILLALASWEYFYWRGNSQPMIQSQSTTLLKNPSVMREKNVIIYSETGFIPNNLTIPAGTVITFKNRSLKPMLFSLAKQNILPGDAWSFTFSSKGYWKYYNQTNGSSGAVTVE